MHHAVDLYVDTAVVLVGSIAGLGGDVLALRIFFGFFNVDLRIFIGGATGNLGVADENFVHVGLLVGGGYGPGRVRALPVHNDGAVVFYVICLIHIRQILEVKGRFATILIIGK